ncbi:YicC/YloC family endoribonuclease [Alicyclobacillus fastidiosus]|uniref:YicC/YloC family endoribonuclease n=1 Tax=Alicyclobacillus fastidiosus TaxID=392011 RepID=A0ABV5AHH4_9BACL|nr:YicC/YloC family endoribonuclease [Alicyclobacillus fastidiosus]WEH08087.1 YicC family protein [Alicyclobacillus fastidiosus]
MSLRSMTGYGQMTCANDRVRVTVEMKTVNHRFAEFHIRVPREWLALEEVSRQELARHVHRGRLDAFLSLEWVGQTADVVVNWKLLDSLIEAEQILLRRFGKDIEAHTVRDWLKFPDVVQVVSPSTALDEIQDVVLQCLREAALKLVDMRIGEGSRLETSFREKLAQLEEQLSLVRRHDGEAIANKHAQLKARLEQLRVEVEPERMAQEVVLLVDRSAVDEEIVRLASHIEAFRDTIAQSGPVGRRLDFIVQEMHREVNTIGAKAADAKIAAAVVEMKVLVEQLREQVQNVE